MKPRRPKSRGVERHKRARQPAPPPPRTLDPREVLANRELFWQNVIREILTSLSMACAQRKPPAAPTPGEPQPAAPEGGAPAQEDEELFDGRLAVITKLGQRIPIADVSPLLACGIPNPRDRALSMAVECTVFQVRTPRGEVFTLPIEELRSFQALSPELMKRLESAARRQGRGRGAGEAEERLPFGFAAFTSLARGGPSIVPPAPEHPTE